MRGKNAFKCGQLAVVGSILFPLLLFWLILSTRIPYSFTRYFHSYFLAIFLVIFLFYYIGFRLSGMSQILICLGLTMILIALSLSYMWSSGFSDNFIIGGLLPYKDAKNYFTGANLLLNGLPMIDSGQATERPLFPGFLAMLLLLTGENLKVGMAIMAQLVGIGVYFSSRQIWRSFGALAASLSATLLYFYIQPLIGYSLSEMLGFIGGCLGLAMLMLAAGSRKWTDLVLGISVLMVAVSARAGAFFIFPMLALWVGWIFRGEKLFSWKPAALTLLGIVAAYFLFNSLYSRLLDIPAGSAFGNFSYALYGQVRGGTGWHSAIDTLGTREPSVVYRAAWEFFLKHPLSLLIGSVKSYRDFFSIGDQSIFPYLNGSYWLDIILWLGLLILIFRGIVRLIKDFHANVSSLLLAGFAGVLLSIPFLPPIDGGSRFYAGTMAFFIALPVVGISRWYGHVQHKDAAEGSPNDLKFSRLLAVALLLLVPVAPLMTYRLSEKQSYILPECPDQQKPFVIDIHQGTYLDLAIDRSKDCSAVPRLCLGDFDKNNVEKKTDDFYQRLFTMVEEENAGSRIVPAIDLVQEKFHYFYFSEDGFSNNALSGTVSGCATETLTKNQTIYQVESILPYGK